MKKQTPVGLVVEGNVTSSRVLRLSCLRSELGPIKSVGLQVARRVSNFLRAGYGVAKYQELKGAQLILLRAPDSQVLRVVAELCEAKVPFQDTAFVLCESWQATEVLAPLKRLGAQIASLCAEGSGAQSYFVVEGDLGAVRRTKHLLSQCRARAIELKPGTKAFYFAANLLATTIPIPVFQMAQQALRESGVSGSDLAALTNEWLDQLQTRVKKGGRAAWGGPLAESSEAIAHEHFQQIGLQNPQFANTLEDWLSLARQQVNRRAKGHSA